MKLPDDIFVKRPPFMVAVDPGKMTGWATCARDGTFEAGEMFAWDFATWYDLVSKSVRLLVCEAYIITPRTPKLSQQTWSLELIGALRYLTLREHTEFELQKPGDAKMFDPRGERLKKLGMWTPGSDHAQDAARHMLLAFVNHKFIDTRALVIG